MTDTPTRRRKSPYGATQAATTRVEESGRNANEQIIRLVGEIYLAYGSLRSLFGTSNARLKMAPLEVIALGAIVEQPQPLTVAQIGRLCGYSRQAVQRAANALIAAGYIQCVGNPRHKRAPLLTATPLGEQAKVKSERCLRLLADDLSETLDPAQLSQLSDELRAFRDRVEERSEALLARLPT